MTAKTLMSNQVVTLKPDDTVAEGLLMMRERNVHNIPVVDEKGCFVGLFSLRRLTQALLPKAARLDDHFLMDMNFMPDNTDDILARLRELGRQPVSELLEKKKKIAFCTPETPIPELLRLLYENPTSLPVIVVTGKKKKLAGMVSNWDVLTKIAIDLVTGQDPSAGASGIESDGETRH